MRLDDQSVELIRQTVMAGLGAEARARLFGSRLDDDAKGGDVDLHVMLSRDVENPVWTASLLAAKLERMLGGARSIFAC